MLNDCANGNNETSNDNEEIKRDSSMIERDWRNLGVKNAVACNVALIVIC